MRTPDDSPIRLGLLLCDDVDKADHARYGSYAEMFRLGFQSVDRHLQLIPIYCMHGELPEAMDDFDAFLISGSRQAAYSSLPWILRLQEFVRACYRQRKKTVGICFGHQLIAHALGGEARQAAVGWGLGVHRTQIIQPQPWMQDSPPTSNGYNLVVLHQDQVVALPPAGKVLAENPFCPISMFAVDDIMLGIQGHPEFDKEFCTYRIHSRKASLNKAVYRQSLASLAMPLDAERVMGWVVRFIRSRGLN